MVQKAVILDGADLPAVAGVTGACGRQHVLGGARVLNCAEHKGGCGAILGRDANGGAGIGLRAIREGLSLPDVAQRACKRLEKELADLEAEGEPHDLNAWLYAQTRDTPWPSVFQDWRAGFLRLLELGESIPEQDLLEAGKYSWLEGYALIDVLEGTYEHHHEHAEHLQPVLARMRQPGA